MCFLRGRIPRIEKQGEIEHEVGLRKTGEKEFTPQFLVMAGTGFFVASSNATFLVTAQHVARDMKVEPEVVVGKKGLTPVVFPPRVLAGTVKYPSWLHHPQADVSIHPILPDLEVRSNLTVLTFDHLRLETNAPSRAIPLAVVGFPLALGVATNDFSPLSRTSHPSSSMLSDKSVRYFLLQDPGVDGYSGSPVFDYASGYFRQGGVVSLGGRQVKVTGVLSGTRNDRSGGKMGVVVPTFYIQELIAKAYGTK